MGGGVRKHGLRSATPLGSSLVGLSLGVVLLAGCGSTSERAEPRPTPSPTVVPSELAIPDHAPVNDPRQVLALVPDSAEVLTLTDYDAIRARLGVPDLTSDDLMTDRSAFWRRATKEAVLLTDGLLREDSSRFMLDHGFTQDDVDWEAHFAGADGAGWVLAFRPDLDMARVRGALGEDTLAGATVLPDQHLLVKGIADEGERVWAMDPAFSDLTAADAESTYLRRGCVPVQTALGPDATYDDQAALAAKQDPTFLRPLEAFTVSFGDQVATARLGVDRIDLHDRADLMDIWPSTGPIGIDEAFEGLAVADPGTGRIGLQVGNPVAAANLTLAETLPFAVCNGVEPTGP